MHIQVTQSKDGSHQLGFASGGIKYTKAWCRNEGEKLVCFIPLTDKDPAIQALAAIGSLAIEASKTRNVPLEELLQKIFEAGVACGKASK